MRIVVKPLHYFLPIVLSLLSGLACWLLMNRLIPDAGYGSVDVVINWLLGLMAPALLLAAFVVARRNNGGFLQYASVILAATYIDYAFCFKAFVLAFYESMKGVKLF